MPRAKRPRRGTRVTAKARAAAATGLQRRLTRLLAERTAARRRHAREIAALKRAMDRRLATMVREIAGLRHHEARVAALTRLVAERDASLAAQAARIAQLEALLQPPTEMG